MIKFTVEEFKKLLDRENDRLEDNAYRMNQGYVLAPAEEVSLIPAEYEITDAD